jgi:hypothetical protein
MAGEDRFKTLRARLADLQVAAVDRLADADTLYQGGGFASAIAMGIYALGIHLKVSICRRMDLEALPQAFEIHDLEALLILSGLKKRMDDPTASRVKYNWSQITARKPQDYLNALRYLPSSTITQAQALDFLGWLRDANDGVIPWITSQP